MVIWVISLLVVYMLFLILLEPLLNKRVKGNYQEHTNEDVSEGLTMSLLANVDGESSPVVRSRNRTRPGYEAAAANDDDSDDHLYGANSDSDSNSISLFDAKDDVTLGASDAGVLAMPSASAGAANNLAAADGLAPANGGVHPMGARGNVLNRVGHQQDKWKRQVREQRKNIYDRHTMLN